MGSCVFTSKALLRLHKWASVALNLQWTAKECFTLKALLLYRDQEWWERTQADEGLGKRNCEATRKFRHGTNVAVRRCEAPFVEVFGVNWKQTSMAEDGTHWHELRWVLVTTILRNYKIRLTSLPEKAKEPQQNEKRLASGRKLQKRHTSRGKEEGESKAGQEPTGAERERMAGAVWTEVWNMRSVGGQCQRCRLAQRNARHGRQLWREKQEEAGGNHRNAGGTVNASGLRTLRRGVGLLDTNRTECSC